MVYSVSRQRQGIQILFISNKQISTITLLDRICRIVLEERLQLEGFQTNTSAYWTGRTLIKSSDCAAIAQEMATRELHWILSLEVIHRDFQTF